MTENTLTQSEADALLAMKKHRVDDTAYQFSMPGETLQVPLISANKREPFFLDINRGRLKLNKVTYQNRARTVVVLARLDIDGPPHVNPDGQEISCPHLHTYREGFGDKWAGPVPASVFPKLDDLWGTLDDFMAYCQVAVPPIIERGLFL
jgi:hypothetical protein